MMNSHGIKILGLDLGKFKTASCLLDTATGEVAFATIPSNPQALRSHLTALAPDRVVLEACPMAGWVSDLARELSSEVQVAHVGGEAWKWNTLERKTDRDDALKLAKLSAMGEVTLVHVPTQATRQHRALIRHANARCSSWPMSRR